jgi:hypothetical protein
MSYLYDWHSLTSSYQEVIINPDPGTYWNILEWIGILFEVA